MDEKKNEGFSVNGEKDSFIIGEGFQVDESADFAPRHAHEKPRKKKKQTKAVLGAVARIFIIIGVSMLLAFTVILFTADYLGIGVDRGHDVVVEVPQGASTIKIAELLKEENAISSPFLFRVYSKLKGFDGRYQYGVYTFNNEVGYEIIAEMLLTEGATPESVRVTIPERASVDDIAKLLAENGVCTKIDFYNALDKMSYEQDFIAGIPTSEVYYRFEGYLFPDTYDFYCYESGVCAELAIDKMLSKMEEVLAAENAYARAEEMGYTLHEVMTMASIVELEASGEPSEMANVAQVFYNRLNTWENPLLGSSPTARYRYGSGRYDTNQVPGIPPGPYCSPSLNAIKAALGPNTENTATYFVTDASMKFYYTYSLAEHNKIISELKAANNWIYEYFD